MNWCRRFVFTVLFAMGLKLAPAADAQETPPKEAAKAVKDSGPLLLNDPRACQGYTLIAPLQSKKTILVDMQGRVVRTWESDLNPGLSAYLLENGNLLRPGKIKSEELIFDGAGTGGRIQEFTWDGTLVWDFKFHNDKQLQHHDVCKMPNGNILMLVWNKKSVKESIEAGRKPSTVRSPWLCDSVVEIKPNGKTGGEVVWEWHVWDHLIQDHDKTKANFGDVAAHPELIDVNFAQDQGFFALLASPGKDDPKKSDPKKTDPKKDDAKIADAKKDELEKLRSIGYVGSGKGKAPFYADWPHLNCVAYNAELDQIMLSSRLMSEFWIIDHSTTTAEAASHKGGKSGKGGDLLYRWGNPRAYRAGTAKDQTLFTQHNAHWIPKGHPGVGHVIVYNNAHSAFLKNYSSVDEIVLPVDGDGKYAHTPGTAFGPEKAVWSYTAPKKSDFYSWVISGAHRLPNGNTLICEGLSGTIFEVTPGKEVVWKYKNPLTAAPPPYTGPSKPGQILSQPLQNALKLTAEQKSRVADLQKSVDERLEKAFLEEQRKSFKEIQDGKSPAGGFPPHGQILTPFLQSRLKLTDDQKKQVAEIQNEIDDQLDKSLDDEQKNRLKSAKASRAPLGGLFDFGDMFGKAVFRSYRYTPDYPGLAGRDLTPVADVLPKKGK